MGAIGIAALRWPADPSVLGYVKWSFVLVATHQLFKLYNRISKPSRVWLYPLLQLARTSAFAALLPIVPIGAAAIVAQIQTRWVPYYIYRLHGATWPGERYLGTFRIISFLTFAALLGITSGPPVRLELPGDQVAPGFAQSHLTEHAPMSWGCTQVMHTRPV